MIVAYSRVARTVTVVPAVVVVPFTGLRIIQDPHCLLADRVVKYLACVLKVLVGRRLTPVAGTFDEDADGQYAREDDQLPSRENTDSYQYDANRTQNNQTQESTPSQGQIFSTTTAVP